MERIRKTEEEFSKDTWLQAVRRRGQGEQADIDILEKLPGGLRYNTSFQPSAAVQLDKPNTDMSKGTQQSKS